MSTPVELIEAVASGQSIDDVLDEVSAYGRGVIKNVDWWRGPSGVHFRVKLSESLAEDLPDGALKAKIVREDGSIKITISK